MATMEQFDRQARQATTSVLALGSALSRLVLPMFGAVTAMSLFNQTIGASILSSGVVRNALLRLQDVLDDLTRPLQLWIADRLRALADWIDANQDKFAAIWEVFALGVQTAWAWVDSFWAFLRPFRDWIGTLWDNLAPPWLGGGGAPAGLGRPQGGSAGGGGGEGLGAGGQAGGVHSVMGIRGGIMRNESGARRFDVGLSSAPTYQWMEPLSQALRDAVFQGLYNANNAMWNFIRGGPLPQQGAAPARPQGNTTINIQRVAPTAEMEFRNSQGVITNPQIQSQLNGGP